MHLSFPLLLSFFVSFLLRRQKTEEEQEWKTLSRVVRSFPVLLRVWEGGEGEEGRGGGRNATWRRV